MASIEKLSIRGIRSFSPNREEIIEFHHPLTVILGDNGCGKTTIIECLKIACTGGLPPGARSGQGLIHDPKIAGTNEVKASVRLRFRNQAGKPMVVQRTYQLKQTRKTVQFKALDGVIRVVNASGEKVSMSHKCSELDRHLPDMLGVSRAILDSVIFCHQEDSNWPLQEGAVLKKRFDDIFESARYTKALDAIKKLKKARDVDAKDLKRDLDVLMVLIQKSDQLHRKASDVQSQLDDLRREKGEAQAEVDDASSKADEARAFKEETESQLAERDRRKERLRLEEKAMQKAHHSLEVERDESDDELKELLQNHNRKVDSFEQERQEVEREQASINQKRQEAEREYTALFQRQGALEAKLEVRQQQGQELLSIAREMQQKHTLETDLSDISRVEWTDLQKEVSALVKDKRTILQTESEQKQREEDELTSEVTKLSSSFHHESERLASLKKVIGTKQEEVKAIGSKLQRMTDLPTQREVQDLEKSIEKDESALKAHLEDGGGAEIARDMDKLQKEIREANDEIGRLNDSAKRLREFDDERKHLSYRQSQLADNRERLETQLQAVSSDCEDLLNGDLTLSNLSTVLESLSVSSQQVQDSLDEKKAETKKVGDQVQDKRSTRIGREKQVEALTSKQTKRKDNVEAFLSLVGRKGKEISIEEARGAVEDAENKYMRTKSTALKAVEAVRVLQELSQRGQAERCCPLCTRAMDEGEVQVFHESIEKKVEEEKDEGANEEPAREAWKGLEKLMPSVEEYLSVEAELPSAQETLASVQEEEKALETKLKGAQEEVQRIEKKLNRYTRTQEKLEQLETKAKALERDDNKLQDEDEELKRREGAHAGGVSSIEDVEKQKDAMWTHSQKLSDSLQEKQKEQTNLQEVRAKLQTDVARKKQNLQEKMEARQEFDASMSQQQELKEHVKEHEKEIGRIEKVVRELEGQVEDSRKKRETFRQEREEERVRKQDELNEVHRMSESIKERIEQINAEPPAALSSQLEGVKEKMVKLNVEKEELVKELEKLQPRLAQLQNNLEHAQSAKRQLRQNMDYRELRASVEATKKEVFELESRISTSLSIEEVNNQLQSCLNRLQQARDRLAQLGGRKHELQRQLGSYEEELESEELADAHGKHRKKMIEYETTRLAADDLDKYYKALDRALLQYHSKKVEELNGIIRTLWQITYKGQDIDTIEVVSGQEEGVASKAGRSYDYRVVMRKAGVKVDMRGRCSAGQKVLAALVIRLALAETFCLNCGVLTLDEPTTNLDTENKYGLAQAITDILEARAQQQNFQLVCITHDEEFVQMLSRTQAMNGSCPETYWRIRREDTGNGRYCSKIERRDWGDGL